MKVLVTGANGFVGSALAAGLAARGHAVRAAARGPLPRRLLGKVEPSAMPDLAGEADLGPLCAGMDAVVHAAGLAHQPPGTAEDALVRVNAEGSARLARAAQARGTGRFILISSIRAVSGAAAPGTLDEQARPAPTDAYGRSKLEAEHRIMAACPAALVLRPPVLHGDGAKANMARLAQAARLPLPLPLAGLAGRRSILSDENLVSAVAFLLNLPDTGGGTYHLADGPPLTVGAMIATMREALGRSPGLFALPFARILLDRLAPALARQLTDDLVVNDTALRSLGWTPAEASSAGLARMVMGVGQTRL